MNSDIRDNSDNLPKEHKVDIHPAMRVRRNPVNSDNLLDAAKPEKLDKPVNLDMPDKPVKSTGTLPTWTEPEESDNPLYGLESDIRALGGHITQMGAMCAIGMESVDPAANWTKAATNPETDETNKEVTHHVGWTILPNSDNPPKRPKRPTYAEMADPAHMARYRAEMREYREARDVARTGQAGSLQMGAEIPVNLDTNDATADVTHERTKGTGSKVLVNVTTSVHSDGKWTTRFRTVYSDTPGKGHIVVKRHIGWHTLPFGANATLDTLASAQIGHLEYIARYAPYGANLVKVGERLNLDNLGKRAQDGESDISVKVLNLDGTNPRVAKATKAARAAKAAKAAKRAKAATAREAMMSDLAALADKVHADRKAPFAPMTRAERDISRKMG